MRIVTLILLAIVTSAPPSFAEAGDTHTGRDFTHLDLAGVRLDLIFGPEPIRVTGTFNHTSGVGVLVEARLASGSVVEHAWTHQDQRSHYPPTPIVRRETAHYDGPTFTLSGVVTHAPVTTLGLTHIERVGEADLKGTMDGAIVLLEGAYVREIT